MNNFYAIVLIVLLIFMILFVISICNVSGKCSRLEEERCKLIVEKEQAEKNYRDAMRHK